MDKFNKHYYTLYHLRNVHITNIIPKVNEFIDAILESYFEDINIDTLFEKSNDLIENNDDLTLYHDFHLYKII